MHIKFKTIVKFDQITMPKRETKLAPEPITHSATEIEFAEAFLATIQSSRNTAISYRYGLSRLAEFIGDTRYVTAPLPYPASQLKDDVLVKFYEWMIKRKYAEQTLTSYLAVVKRFLIWRVGWKWYLAAFLLYPAIFVSAVLLNAAFTQTPMDFSTVAAHRIFGASASLPMFILPFFIFDALTNGEEMGWRGYVLPRLQAKHSALVSSLILGVVWGFWHLPKYLAPGNTGSFALGMVKILADAVLYTWLYNNTKGSLLLVTFLHAAGNTGGGVPAHGQYAFGKQYERADHRHRD